MTVRDMLNDQEMLEREKLEVLLDFVDAYEPWAILFEEHLKNWLKEREEVPS